MSFHFFDPYREDKDKAARERGEWRKAFIGGAYDFLNNGERMLDARSLFHYYAAGITPAMAYSKPGTGSAYAYATRWAATWTVARPTRSLFQLPYRLVSFGRSW